MLGQLYHYVLYYIHIYIYIYVCVCVCVCKVGNAQLTCWNKVAVAMMLQTMFGSEGLLQIIFQNKIIYMSCM